MDIKTVIVGDDTYTVRISTDAEQWSLGGRLHRHGGPSMKWLDGPREAWTKMGAPHREDGPAVMTKMKRISAIRV